MRTPERKVKFKIHAIARRGGGRIYISARPAPIHSNLSKVQEAKQGEKEQKARAKQIAKQKKALKNSVPNCILSGEVQQMDGFTILLRAGAAAVSRLVRAPGRKNTDDHLADTLSRK